MSETSTYSLRPATLSDVPVVADIERRVHRAPWIESHFEAELAKPYAQFLLLTDDETDTRIAAYIVFWLMFDECQILNLAVDLPYRGLGFGKQLVRAAVQQALRKGISKTTLEVRKSNQAAVQLYQSVGFTITQVRKGFYSDGEDAYHMMLDVSQQPIEF